MGGDYPRSHVLDGLAGAMWRRARPPGRGTSSASDANGKCFATGSVGTNTTPIVESSNHSHTPLTNWLS